jgi:hypothetical protein
MCRWVERTRAARRCRSRACTSARYRSPTKSALVDQGSLLGARAIPRKRREERAGVRVSTHPLVPRPGGRPTARLSCAWAHSLGIATSVAVAAAAEARERMPSQDEDPPRRIALRRSAPGSDHHVLRFPRRRAAFSDQGRMTALIVVSWLQIVSPSSPPREIRGCETATLRGAGQDGDERVVRSRSPATARYLSLASLPPTPQLDFSTS